MLLPIYDHQVAGCVCTGETKDGEPAEELELDSEPKLSKCRFSEDRFFTSRHLHFECWAEQSMVIIG